MDWNTSPVTLGAFRALMLVVPVQVETISTEQLGMKEDIATLRADLDETRKSQAELQLAVQDVLAKLTQQGQAGNSKLQDGAQLHCTGRALRRLGVKGARQNAVPRWTPLALKRVVRCQLKHSRSLGRGCVCKLLPGAFGSLLPQGGRTGWFKHS